MNKKKVEFVRYCKRCGKMFRTSTTKAHKVVCPDCYIINSKILRVKDTTYNLVHLDVKKYSKEGLILTPDKIINAYQKVIKKFRLNKEIDKIIQNGKDY
jgi:DNA-directed RNA polymerase subunit RPC12/RpoP